jgi:predicted metal-dependent peptidase
MMNDEKRGLMPGHFLSQVEAVNKPAELSWQAILKKYIGTISANKRKTRMRLNRRQPERFDLSGRVDDKVLKIAVAIDTSGSVDDHMIGKIFNEIFAILAKRKHEITVIECDAVVQRVYKARSRSDIKQKVAGRGGTRFTPVIEYVNDDKYFRDALLIYFTDGYGESKIPKPMTYRNIWVVFGDSRHLSLNESYGVALTLKD